METEPVPEHLTLLRALLEWCDLRLVNSVRIAERGHTAGELSGYMRNIIGFPEPRLTPPDQWRQSPADDWMRGGPTNFTQLNLAWDALSRYFRAQIETGALYLEGVEVTGTYDAEPQALRGAFASEYEFDFNRNVLRIGKKRYTAVTVSRTPGVWAGIEGSTIRPRHELTPGDVPDLTDEFILALLEEHAKRVVKSEAPNMFPPGKISLMPIIRRKMRWRAEHRQLLSSITAEAGMLESWIKAALPSHQTPTAATIKKVMGPEYEALKTRSTGAI